jgi:ribulose-phosphate 3-epimerase
LDQHFKRILNEQEGIPFWEDVDFELDLMVSNAVENFDIYLKLGPRRIIFHLESVGDLNEFQNFLEGIDMYVRDVTEIGVAINPGTLLTNIFPIINNIDFVQCMGIGEIGFQGQKFDEKCLEQIKGLKEKFPDLIISVDGGVNFETGADRLVAGSAIFSTNDILGAVERFRSL